MRAALALAVLALTAPASAAPIAPDAPTGPEVDLLIVVDTGPHSPALRAAFATGLPRFASSITEDPSIDLHVGVITSDRADGGALRTASALDCAAAPDRPFVAYAAGAPVDFHGALADAIACLLPPAAASSDANAQPFATASFALGGAVAANAGFRRPEATLAILFVSAQDDCSHDGAALDPFACATEGWSCTPALDATVGPRTCVAAPTTPLGDVTAQASYFESLAPTPTQLAIGAIIGDPTQVTVVSGPAIAPTCTQGERIVGPAMRLAAVANGSAHGWIGDACASPGDYAQFATTILYASVPPGTPGDDCDGGFPVDPVDPAGHPLTGCVGCASDEPTGGTALAFALAALVAFRRSSASRRYRG